MDRRLIAVFAAGLLLGAGFAAWGVLQMDAPDKPAETAAAPSAKADAVTVSAPAAKADAPAALQHAHVACPASAVIAAAGKDDGMMRLRSEPDTAAEISQLILSGKEAAAAGRPRDAELTFLAACKAADKLQRADATEPTDARYQLARHYAHYVLVGNAPPANRAELLRRAEALYADAQQAYLARFGAEHEKTRFASEGLAALKQSPAVAQAAPAAAPKAVAVVAPAPAPVPAPVAKAAPAQVATPVTPAPVPAPRAVVAAEPRAPGPAAVPRPAVVERPVRAEVAEAPRPRRAPRVVEPEPEVIEAPVRQATGTSRSDSSQ